MASEIFDVALKGDSQRMLRRGRIPAGSTFADLERYILRSMGWDRDVACGFRIPGSESPMEDRDSPLDAYGRMPVDYFHGRTTLRITLLGVSDPDYSKSPYASRRSPDRSKSIRLCLRRWEESLRSSSFLDDEALSKVAAAISSSRRTDAYLDTKTMKVTERNSEGAILIRRGDSAFLKDAATEFCRSEGLRPPAQGEGWYGRFLQDLSRSSKNEKAWRLFLEGSSTRAAEEWAEDNGLRGGEPDPSHSGLLPCRYCGKRYKASEDRSGMPVMADRPRYPMAVFCPDCGKHSVLSLFNDGFGLEYCFRGESRSCWVTGDLSAAKRRAESETDPDEKARLLLMAALEAYRCGKAEEAEELMEKASERRPEESAAVSAYIGYGQPCEYGGRDPIARILSECVRIRSETDYRILSEAMDAVDGAIEELGLPEWLEWDLRLSEILGLCGCDDAARSFGRMERIIGSCLDSLKERGSATGDECRLLCSMTEAATRFSFRNLDPEHPLRLLDEVYEAFSEGPIRSPAVASVVLLRKGIIRMSMSDDDEAVDDLVAVIDAMMTRSGRGPVAGRRAFTAMLALYPYDPESMDLITIAVNSMNAMSLSGAVTEHELEELLDAVPKALKAGGEYSESRKDVEAWTNIKLGPEPEEFLTPDDLMDLRFSYYLP
ncbi:MAG: hypothetical protein IKP53_02585 [Candidatus Methanomethylophilaceae archaeon]|nr:hypothetical protein [Candidatus Methanomethylophilaceae archaeon]